MAIVRYRHRFLAAAPLLARCDLDSSLDSRSIMCSSDVDTSTTGYSGISEFSAKCAAASVSRPHCHMSRTPPWSRLGSSRILFSWRPPGALRRFAHHGE
ncbi:hypothetical protein RHECIAT_PC0000712 (plasmid) [Rhizobium etli CIAT 652]|uniref:Uncharacterized protein n=1 Tax=Rhizobium etli (strain CIAT 652) TaxID=491916 RepID=B3Q3N2_RHIE6|nr:hypothetical protein RHECIAT_PC0000712 [Rhizobium etli CIAT 652]